MLFSMLNYLGIEKERTRVEWVSAAEGAKFAETMNEFTETILKLGENKRLEDLRCLLELQIAIECGNSNLIAVCGDTGYPFCTL